MELEPTPQRAGEIEELIDQATRMLERLESPAALETFGRRLDERSLRDALVISMRAARLMAMSLGECQQAVPYSPLRPVLRPDGTMQWCCNHDTEHCG